MAPFLELDYFIGDRARAALRAVVSDADPQCEHWCGGDLVGLGGNADEALIVGGRLVLRGDGALFDGPPEARAGRVQEEAVAGGRVYARFLEVVDLVRPDYAAILIEYALEEPDELIRDPRSLAFRDFYVDRDRIGHAATTEILKVVKPGGAYVELRRRGLYVSMSAPFNPERRALESEDAQWKSARIGLIVGKAMRSRTGA